MIITLIYLIVILCYLNILTKGTNRIYSLYETNLAKNNEHMPIEFILGRTKDFGSKFVKKIIKQYNVTKNKEHLFFLLWNEILGESFAYLCASVFIAVFIFIMFLN